MKEIIKSQVRTISGGASKGEARGVWFGESGKDFCTP
jgi:hypothetical protein